MESVTNLLSDIYVMLHVGISYFYVLREKKKLRTQKV